MRIQELIDKLIEVKDEHGNLKVMHSGCCGCSGKADWLKVEPERDMIWINDDRDKP